VRRLTSRAAALLLLLLAPLAGADENLWTASKGGKRALGLESFVKLARTLGPAVVNVVAVHFEEPEGGGRPRRGRGQGTGFVIHKSGYILTNAHVIDRAEDVRVRLADERELAARVVGRDEHTDIALLKVEAGRDLTVAPLGDSDTVEIGEWVIAIGNPFGLDHTVTAGIVSAKGRRDVRPGGAGHAFYDFIQTDASINPGNSGGPLINTRGEVIGMNTAMNAQAQGIGFSIPINMVKVIAPLLLKHGHAPRSSLGLTVQPLNDNLRKAFKIEEGLTGALVGEVLADSPAARAGIQPGDVIISFRDRPVRRADDLSWLMSTATAGKQVTLGLRRGGKPLKLDLVPVPESDEKPPAGPVAPKVAGRRSPLGITVSEISADIAKELGTPGLYGVVVMSVEPDSPALEAGVERGDVILRVDDALITNLDEYAKAVRAAPQKAMLRLLVKRDTRSVWLAFPKR
jgi:Do/DeqQ family serine protease